ncbi:MAG: hypothetical protein R3C14_08895 [Caldilineaceae bacterium]
MFEFVVIVESAADFRTASEIANRICTEQIGWIEPYLTSIFKWVGLQNNTEFSCWRDIDKIREEAKANGIHLPRSLGRAQPLKADGAIARKTLQLITQLQRKRDIRAVVFVRDLDNQVERRTSLEEAREEYAQRFSSLMVVIGLANRMREAWVLNGFLPLDKVEESILAELQQKLLFDPTLEAHRLRATTLEEPERIRNPKVVLNLLTKEDSERERHCWQSTPLDLLRTRGSTTGLTQYMNEVKERLAPLLR